MAYLMTLSNNFNSKKWGTPTENVTATRYSTLVTRHSLLLWSFFAPLFFFFFAIAALLHADPSEETKKPVLLLEPSFYHHPIATLIPGAKKTVVTAAWVEKKSTTISFLEPGWNTTRSAFMSRFVQEGRETLSERLSLLRPRFLRDEHQVIQVAIIESDDPLTASTILAPNFAQQFVKIFGPELLLMIPTANLIYVFSKLASSINSLAPAIRDDYKLSSSTVSLEIFELDFKLGEGRLRAIGSVDSL